MREINIVVEDNSCEMYVSHTSMACPICSTIVVPGVLHKCGPKYAKKRETPNA